jgi:Photoprotection regulator fluorescence recovery protein
MTTPVDMLRWSAAEKKIARRVFDQALQRELDEVIQEVKQMPLDIKEPSDVWKMEEYLTKRRRAIDSDYDYRDSQLPLVFGVLVRRICKGWMKRNWRLLCVVKSGTSHAGLWC